MKNKEKIELYKVKNKTLSKYKKTLKANPTKHELILKQRLIELGINFTFQKVYFNEDFSCIIDFFFKVGKEKLAVEIDGNYHLNKKQITKDANRDNWLYKNRKCKTIRFTNDMIDSNVDVVIEAIMKNINILTS